MSPLMRHIALPAGAPPADLVPYRLHRRFAVPVSTEPLEDALAVAEVAEVLLGHVNVPVLAQVAEGLDDPGPEEDGEDLTADRATAACLDVADLLRHLATADL